MKNSVGKIITIIIFLGFVFGFFGYTLLKADESYSETENRTLAESPEFNVKDFFAGKFSSDYEEYVKDQFPMREEFVALKNYSELALGKSELNGVFIGKDGYLIENHKADEYSTDRAEKNKDAVISAGNRWAEKLGVEHTSIMVVPTAQSVLKDKLPLFASPYDQTEYISEIKSGLKDGVFVDVTDVLSERSDEYIYYRTDHHWTTYGAYLAYKKWCSDKEMEASTQDDFVITGETDAFLGTIHSKININTDADTIEIYYPKDYNVKAVYNMRDEKDSLFDRSFLKGKDKYGVFFGGNQGIVEITDEKHDTVTNVVQEENYNSGGNEKILLILKDSYANCFTPMVLGMYDRVYVVDLRYFNMNIDAFMEMYGVTDVLLLYNAGTMTDDVYVSRIK